MIENTSIGTIIGTWISIDLSKDHEHVLEATSWRRSRALVKSLSADEFSAKMELKSFLSPVEDRHQHRSRRN